MTNGNKSKRVHLDNLHVNGTDRPGWLPGTERMPRVGEEVYCAGGACTVETVLGKTGDGSRLLQIRLESPGAKPFFAAASNVLIAPA